MSTSKTDTEGNHESDGGRSSIHDLEPLEKGGVTARHGFDVQDHVATAFFIRMLEDPKLLQLWCETHDDITLIWEGSDCEEIEFVQVKSHELDQLWSIAKLCEREKATQIGSSLYERSLANDRCLELCWFRIVTCRPVQSLLHPLTLPFDAPDRKAKVAEIAEIAADISVRTASYTSANGNGPDYWLERLQWQVCHSLESIQHSNLVRLRGVIEKLDGYLFNDQLDDLYSKILTILRTMATRFWGTDPSTKKIRREEALAWLARELSDRMNPIPVKGGTNLSDKMRKATIPADDIESSNEARRQYLAERLRPKYLSLSEREHVDAEVAATLHALRARLDAGEIADSGVTFHALCISELQTLQGNLRTSEPVPLSYLFGCMYSIADRCTHRFRRASA